MGLFDRLRPDPPLTCPNCGEPHLDELQTKAFPDAYLRDFRAGERLPDEDQIEIIEGRVAVITHCGEPCSSANPDLVFLSGFALIKDGAWTGAVTWEPLAAAAPS